MRSYSRLPATVFAAFVVASGWARAGHAAAPTKIGYIDARLVLTESEEWQVTRKQIDSESATKHKELEQLRGDLQARPKQFEATQAVLSPSAAEKARAELAEQVQDFDKRSMEADAAQASATQAANEQFLAKLQPFVQKLAADEGYAYVLEKSLIFVAPAEHDLTHQLLRKVNEAYRALQAGKHAPSKSKGN